jgi:hypothetical protein
MLYNSQMSLNTFGNHSSMFPEHTWTTVRVFPEHARKCPSKFSEQAWKCCCPHACSGNIQYVKMPRHVQRTYLLCSSVFLRTRLSGFQVCLVQQLQIMNHFAGWGLQLNLNAEYKKKQAKGHFKKRQPTRRKYWFNIKDDKKGQNSSFPSPFKGIVIEIFWLVFLPVYKHLGLNVNCFWF